MLQKRGIGNNILDRGREVNRRETRERADGKGRVLEDDGQKKVPSSKIET